MSEHKREVIHEIKLTTGTKLLLAAAVVALVLNAVLPAMRAEPVRAQSYPDSVSMRCSGVGDGDAGHYDISLRCRGSLN